MNTGRTNAVVHQAGADLDALVGMKVMGWKTCNDQGCEGCDATVQGPLAGGSSWYTAYPGDSVREFMPSRKIEDAFLALAKANELCCDFSLEKAGKNWHAVFGAFSEQAATPELAICLVLLKFVGGV